MNRKMAGSVVILLAAMPTIAGAQQAQRPPIRQLGAITASSSEKLTNVPSIRALSNGSVLVNDMTSRRVVMFDPQLSKFTVIADSTSATGNAYGGRIGSLIAYRGDSSIFADPTSVSMLILDPSGKVARVVAIPRAEDAVSIGSPIGGAVFDGKGLIYRTSGFRFGGGNARQIITGGAGRGLPPMPDMPDSTFLVRVDLATRKLDTVGVIRIPKVKLDMKTDDRGGMSITSQINPLPVVDEWAVTPDGAIALIRGRDYHVDWINPDGTKVSAPKIPFDWQRLTDEDKVAFIDSVKAARERQGANAPIPLTGALGGGGANIQFNIGTGPPGAQREGATRGAAPGAAGAAQFNFIPANELPDYKPPFFAGSVRADNDGNVWVRTIPTTAIAGGPVYDVINRKGELIDRVQIPAGRTIVGFGSDGSVYLLNRENATATATLEKASVR
jgi:hypothetical protein